MSDPIIWLIDPDTGEDIPVRYSDLEDEVKQSLFTKPLGGFCFPADLFIQKKLPSAPFYIKGWLPKRGKAMLYAPPKSGKSFLCLQTARCIASGEPLLGIPTSRGRVLYLQFELGEEVLQGRLLSTGQSYENVYVGTSFSMKLDSKSGQQQLWAAMEAVEPSVLILDPLYKAILGDENETADVLKILDFLDSVIEGFNCSILIIHHAGKDLSKRGRGSSVLEDWVDSDIKMQATNSKGEPLKIKLTPIFLRHAPLTDEPIEAELTNFEFALTTKALTVKQQVLNLINSAQEPTEPKQIFDLNIGSNTSVYKALKELTNEKKIVKDGWGKYGKC